MKRSIRILLAALVLALACTACGGKKEISWNGKTEIMAQALMVLDVTDPYLYAGVVDYVFVGTVEDIPVQVIPEKPKKSEDYFSTYTIHVDQNLKGELVETITARKRGGMKKDGTMYVLACEMPDGTIIPDTYIPQKGDRFVFLAYSQPDGSLHLSELLDDRDVTDELIAEYEDYVENQTPVERERFPSSFDRAE